jgi:hypothetical protein
MKLFNWTDKSGKEVSWKEFKQRWAKGINEVTPIQRLESSIFFQQIMTLGFFLGLCLALYNYKSMWWLAIILFGGLGMNILQYKGLKQQLDAFKNIEIQMKLNDLEREIKEDKEVIITEGKQLNGMSEGAYKMAEEILDLGEKDT